MMINRETIIQALKEKPLKEYPLLMRVDPSGSVDALRDELLKMRDAGLVKFDIRKGLWFLPEPRH
jgi:hypothetical protein